VKKRILVFGGTGMLGQVVVKHLVSKGHEVTFTTRKQIPSWMPMRQKVGIIQFEIGQRIPDLSEYDWVINCLGAIKQKTSDPFTLYSANAVFPWQLSFAAKEAGSKLIHISSDCVFSGKSLNGYLADAEMDAEDDYGKSKMLGEPLSAIILRTSIIGPSPSKTGLFSWFFQQKEECFGYENHLWSGVTTLFLAEFIEGLISNPPVEIPDSGGLIQIASPPVNKFQLLNIIKDTWGLETKVIPQNFVDSVINRVLFPTVALAPEIHEQLVMLKNWMIKENVEP